MFVGSAPRPDGGQPALPWQHSQSPPLPFPPAVSVILAYFVSSDGSSNWLLGLQLVITYLLIAAVFLLEREPKNAGGTRGAAPRAGL